MGLESWTGYGNPYSSKTATDKSSKRILFWICPPVIYLFYYWCREKVKLIRKTYKKNNGCNTF